MSKPKTEPKPKAEPSMAIRPRVGSALARVRGQVEAAGGNMTVVVHELAERHETEIVSALNGPAEIPGFD